MGMRERYYESVAACFYDKPMLGFALGLSLLGYGGPTGLRRLVDDGRERREILLNSPNLGVYLPPMMWCIQYKYSADTVLLVFALHYYDAADYIREYVEFWRLGDS